VILQDLTPQDDPYDKLKYDILIINRVKEDIYGYEGEKK